MTPFDRLGEKIAEAQQMNDALCHKGEGARMNYDIGDWVRVTAVHERKVAGGTVTWERKALETPLVGRVTGMCKRYDGKRTEAPGSYYDFEPGPNYLEILQSHTFFEVRAGWRNKPMLVAVEDLEPCEPQRTFPRLHRKHKWSEQARNFLQEASRDFPRDAKGRWAKEAKA